MDPGPSLDALTATKADVEISGKTYKASKMTVRMFGQLKAYYRSQVTCAMADACKLKRFAPEATRDAMRRVAATPIGLMELNVEFSTPDMQAELLWLSINDNHQDFGKSIVHSMSPQDLESAMQQYERVFPSKAEVDEDEVPLEETSITA